MTRTAQSLLVCSLAAAALAASSPAVASQPFRTPIDAPGPLLSGGPGAHASFRRLGYRWPRGRITYYNAAKKNAWAVRQAVRAWNRSGARVRFVAARRSRAKVIIQYFPGIRGCVPAGRAPYRAIGRRALRGRVLISRPDPSNPSCSRWALALITAHELGHILGLDHETRRCAQMNKTLVNFAPDRCPRLQQQWQWRCRMLERDDVRGAVRLYGGRVKPRPQAVCDMSPPPLPVTELAAGPPPEGFGLAIRFRRPKVTPQPAHLSGGEGYEVSATAGACPQSPPASFSSEWSVPPGGIQEATVFPATDGLQCVAVRNTHSGRASQLATTFVNYTAPF